VRIQLKIRGFRFAGAVSAGVIFATMAMAHVHAQPHVIDFPAATAVIVESPARAEVEKLIRESGADVAIAFRTLDTPPQELMLNEDELFHAASTMKIPVMIELFAEVHAGKLRLDDKLPIKNEFRSIMDGSAYQLDPKDDSDEEVYKAIGTSWTLRELCEAMITRSSNLATDLIIEKLGVANIQARVHQIGADDMHVLRGVEDEKAFQAGKNNTTSANALYLLLRGIADHSACDVDSCKQMLEILERQTFNEAIPAGLPPGRVIAHKTGEITGIHHDAAIVFGRRPFVLVILVKGIGDRTKSSALMAAITRAIYAGLPH
jgi:beta-lactamase class A